MCRAAKAQQQPSLSRGSCRREGAGTTTASSPWLPPKGPLTMRHARHPVAPSAPGCQHHLVTCHLALRKQDCSVRARVQPEKSKTQPLQGRSCCQPCRPTSPVRRKGTPSLRPKARMERGLTESPAAACSRKGWTVMLRSARTQPQPRQSCQPHTVRARGRPQAARGRHCSMMQTSSAAQSPAAGCSPGGDRLALALTYPRSPQARQRWHPLTKWASLGVGVPKLCRLRAMEHPWRGG
mmetsp:Transcript_113218/g.365847  ORF Transcript_113218/g.365847 Transcript_113218/m.365847 type:complete len:238 (+) Transcript_113218:1265-1978(+)